MSELLQTRSGLERPIDQAASPPSCHFHSPSPPCPSFQKPFDLSLLTQGDRVLNSPKSGQGWREPTPSPRSRSGHHERFPTHDSGVPQKSLAPQPRLLTPGRACVSLGRNERERACCSLCSLLGPPGGPVPLARETRVFEIRIAQSALKVRSYEGCSGPREAAEPLSVPSPQGVLSPLPKPECPTIIISLLPFPHSTGDSLETYPIPHR